MHLPMASCVGASSKQRQKSTSTYPGMAVPLLVLIEENYQSRITLRCGKCR